MSLSQNSKILADDVKGAIKDITRSGTTFTYTCLDGTTGTFTQQDNNTTYSAGTGISISSNKISNTGVTSVNGSTGAVTVNTSSFPSGTKMLFHQSAAPTGWTKQTSINDSALRVVSGTTGGGTGGSVAFSTLFATGKTVSLSGNVGATTLTVSQMPSHNHLIANTSARGWLGAWQASGGRVIDCGGGVVYYPETNSATGYDGSSNSHTHSLSGTASIALNVKYTDIIICAKD
jgi:hypothetical protein